MVNQGKPLPVPPRMSLAKSTKPKPRKNKVKQYAASSADCLSESFRTLLVAYVSFEGFSQEQYVRIGAIFTRRVASSNWPRVDEFKKR